MALSEWISRLYGWLEVINSSDDTIYIQTHTAKGVWSVSVVSLPQCPPLVNLGGMT
jgi:hypothetical protein